MNSKFIVTTVVSLGVVFYSLFSLLNEEYIKVAVIFGCLSLLLINNFDKIALCGALTTKLSALLLPLPGSPFWWEGFSVLGWVGLLVALFKSPKLFVENILRFKWLFGVLLTYVIFLIVQMLYHDVGFLAMGGSVTGGRSYFSQIVIVSIPVLAMVVRVNTRELFAMVLLVLLGSLTYLISDLWAMNSWTGAEIIFQFLSPPYDTLAYASAYESGSTELKRFQSFAHVSFGLLLALCAFFKLKKGQTFKVLVFLGFGTLIIGIGALGGSRGHLLILGFTIFGFLWAIRKITPLTILLVSSGGTFVIACCYLFASKLPLSVQRTLSILPGIKIDHATEMDAYYTALERENLRKTGVEMIKEHFWMGRSFGVNEDYFQFAAMTSNSHDLHVARNAFLNGPISTFVTCGIGGMILAIITMYLTFKYAIEAKKLANNFKGSHLVSRLSGFFAAYSVAIMLQWIFVTGNAQNYLVGVSTTIAWILICLNNEALSKVEVSDVQDNSLEATS